MVYSRGNLATENLLWEKGELIKKKKIVNTHTHTHTHTVDTRGAARERKGRSRYRCGGGYCRAWWLPQAERQPNCLAPRRTRHKYCPRDRTGDTRVSCWPRWCK